MRQCSKFFATDISFYLLAVFAVYFIWWDGKINVYECIAFLGYYVVYVMVAVLSHYCCGKKPEQAHTVSREIRAYPLIIYLYVLVAKLELLH